MCRFSFMVLFYLYLKYAESIISPIITFYYKCPWNTTPYYEESDTYAVYHSYMVPLMNRIRFELANDTGYEQLKKRITEFDDFVDKRVSLWADKNKHYPHTEDPASLPEFDDFFYSKYFVPFANMIRFNICGVSNAPYTIKPAPFFFTTRKFYDMRRHTYTLNYEEWARRMIHRRIFTDSDEIFINYDDENTTVTVPTETYHSYRDKFIDLFLKTDPMPPGMENLENTVQQSLEDWYHSFAYRKDFYSSTPDIKSVFSMKKTLPTVKNDLGKDLEKEMVGRSRENVTRSAEDQNVQK